MKIILDQYIPFLADYLPQVLSDSSFPTTQILSIPPEQITSVTVRDADALFIRTRTRANQALLKGSKVRFIATATIGTDHLDIPYLEHHGIHWVSTPGCNAQAVCDYIETAIRESHVLENKDHHTIGIIGCGHIGSRVQNMAEKYGFLTLINDPLKGYHTPIERIAQQADVITFHTPLIRTGRYKTYHLCDTAFLSNCRPNTLIINAARGGIVDEQALLTYHHDKNIQYILDTWENEPDIDHQILANAQAASFHIAGYSLEGKINASQKVLDAFCQFFRLTPCVIDKKAVISRSVPGDTSSGWLSRITEQLKAHPEKFEIFRKNYIFR